MRLVIITGLSGSGKSIALHTLEDLGYYCIDNLPLFLLEVLARRLIDQREPAFGRTAVGIDARGAADYLKVLPDLVRELRGQGIDASILFFEAQAETLIRRFSETRRKHPLSGRDRPLAEALELERQLLQPVRIDADLCIDTTHTNVHELRELVRTRVQEAGQEVSVMLLSFGFKHGVPRDVDFVFDMRCLPNPHWQPQLRPLTGRDPEVAAFLESSPGVREMRDDLGAFLDRWIPAFEAEGRSYLTIALGCTGGQHRSVYMVEQLKAHLERGGRKAMARHRELP